MINYPEIERRNNLNPPEFFRNYVGKKAVIMSGLVTDWLAVTKWNKNYFYQAAAEKKILIEIVNSLLSKKEIRLVSLKDYISQVLDKNPSAENKEPRYFYDSPLPSLLTSLKHDMEPFPLKFFPKWYRSEWWKNLFFFSTQPETLIPMHFDGLGTHNTYFHLKGRKKFIIISPEYINGCYRYDYNAFQVDPEQPDLHKHPLFKNVQPQQAYLSPGDVLYLPPYTLHQVKSIDACLSVKLDWHTAKSIVVSFKNLYHGISAADAYYNFIFSLGILFKIPARFLYPQYKKSLSRLRHSIYCVNAKNF